MGKIHAASRYRYRATAAERRMYGGATVTEFFVYRDEDKNDASRWRIVRGYGRTPGERKTDAIRRSGLLDEPSPGRDPRRRRIKRDEVEAWRGATSETSTWHNWHHAVELTAIRKGAPSEALRSSRVRQIMQRAYRNGEPVWMAADEVAFVAKTRPTPDDRETLRRAVLARYRDPSRAAEVQAMTEILRRAGYDRPSMRARQLHRRGFDARTLRAELVEARRRDPRRR